MTFLMSLLPDPCSVACPRHLSSDFPGARHSPSLRAAPGLLGLSEEGPRLREHHTCDYSEGTERTLCPALSTLQWTGLPRVQILCNKDTGCTQHQDLDVGTRCMELHMYHTCTSTSPLYISPGHPSPSRPIADLFSVSVMLLFQEQQLPHQ